VALQSVDRTNGPNYAARRGTFVVTYNGDAVTTMRPEKRIYPVTGMPTTEAAIHTTFFADLYVVLGDPDLPVPPGGQVNFLADVPPDMRWTVRLYHNPLVAWIWAGAIIMALGGVVSLTDRRHRVGAPARARLAVAAAGE
jgi:cytochrome c-type biogenesis protein CcmF